ncbi:hypothetical protein CYY_001705 [Polysphondylium violaceum]|uniref:Ubiquitin carboxyl-terminal hydrolase n=1 Tax=Polysphondylium violaceum TaxID=133409 RepID=A0A8J4UVY1_9MYCE|nr:hypothetical protein CYY_001705 [Polysphondylium violaceum]
MGLSSSKIDKALENFDQFPPNERFFGLENFGNTCYCNSVVQVLFYCLPFRQRVLQYYCEQKSLPMPTSTPNVDPVNINNNNVNSNNNTQQNYYTRNVNNNSSNTTTTTTTNNSNSSNNRTTANYNYNNIDQDTDSLILCLGELFYTIMQQKKRTGVISPKRFVERLKHENELFRSYMHQDAHEFLNFLLNSITEFLQKQQQQPNGKDVNSNNSSKKEVKTFVHEIFEGTLTNETKCLTCESVTNKDESFLDLSIDIGQNRSLTSCLSNFSSVETLSQNDKFYCDKCNSLQEAQKRMKIKQLPNTLIIHLKRFKFFEAFQQYKKLNYRVVFPFEIIVQNTTNDIVDPDKKFYLFAVVIHVGNGPNHGHYVSMIKSHGVWFIFDDDNIDIIQESDIYNCFGSSNDFIGSNDCGYLLFYQSESQ